MGGGAQVLHDINKAQANLLRDYPEISADMQAWILKRTTGRAWKWVKRNNGRTVFSKHFKRYLMARIAPHTGNTSDRVRQTCEAFYETSDRFPVRLIEETN